jgi:hypothetical protein
MKRTRCDYGIHLDMNAGHTGFEFYRVRPEADLPKPEKPLDRMWEARGAVLMKPGWDFSARLMVRKMPLMNFPRYIQRNSRDFFYLTRRALLPGPRLEPFAGGPESDGRWRVAGIAHNGWPHAVAITRLTVPRETGSPVTVWLTRVDPKQVRIADTAEAQEIGSIELPASDDERAAAVQLWKTSSTFLIAPAVPVEGARALAAGAPKPEKATRSAACVDRTGMLVLAEARRDQGKGSANAIRESLDHAGCETTVYFSEPAVFRPHGDQSENGDADRTKAGGVHLIRRPSVGAVRIFEDTPVVPPERWAFAQRRRVPYAGSSSNEHTPR